MIEKRHGGELDVGHSRPAVELAGSEERAVREPLCGRCRSAIGSRKRQGAVADLKGETLLLREEGHVRRDSAGEYAAA